MASLRPILRLFRPRSTTRSPSHFKGIVAVRALSMSAERRPTKEEEDMELQNSFNGLFPKLKVMWDLFSDENSTEKIESATHRSIRQFSRDYTKKHVPLGVYISLQNPLLKKYAFDSEEFLEGAEIAVDSLLATLRPTELSVAESLALLKNICTRNVQGGFESWRRLIEKGEAEPTDVNIMGISLTGLSTDIVTKDKDSDIEKTLNILRPEVVVAGPADNSDIPDELTSLLESYHEYKEGSVVADITVEVLLENNSKRENEQSGISGLNRIMIFLNFQGVISGQTPLDWKVSKVVMSHPLIQERKDATGVKSDQSEDEDEEKVIDGDVAEKKLKTDGPKEDNKSEKKSNESSKDAEKEARE